MKNYELLTVFKPNLDADEVDKILAKISENVNEFGGKIISIEKMGRRKLAYEIQKFRDGFFTDQILSLPENKVVELRRLLKLNDNVLRVMFLEVSKHAAAV